MGVHGLWRLIEPSGKPVPLESLENKVLAVDVSIWLHQIVKGFQDAKGGPLPNAHLLGIYHRLCKLLYFRIKPVFVFDGGVPVLKKQTIALRNQQKAKTLGAADRLHKNLLSALVKHSAISKVLSEKAKAALSESHSPPKKPKTDDDDLYVLPPSQPLDSTLSSSEDESSADDSRPSYDLHSINTESAEFKSLPVDVRHEILSDLKDTRKQSSWGRIHELPTESDDFSVYQMNRLLKRQSVQVALEEVEKEMGGHSLSLGELETLLKDQGVITNLKGSRIASDENTRFLLIKDIKQAVEEAKKQNLATIEEGESDESMEKMKNKGDIEYEDDLKKAIAMSLEEAPSTSKASEEASSSSKSVKKIGGKGKKRMSLSFLENFEDADFGESESSEEETIQIRLTPAQRYMMEYSGLTPNEIAKIIASKNGASKKANIEEAKIGKPVVQPAESTSDASRTADSGQETVTGSGIEEVNVSELIRIEEQEDRVTTSSSREVEEEKDECLELKSDSESNDSDDFLDVEDSNVEQVKKNVPSMEVVIKPDEELEDDLFKDIFDNEDKAEVASEVSSTQDKVIESIKQFVSSSREEEESKKVKENIKKVETEADSSAVESIVVSDRKEECLNEASSSAIENLEVSNDKESSSAVEEVKSTSQTVKDKIEKLIKDYSRPKEAEPDSSKLSVDQLNEMRENLRKEEAELATEKSTKERHAGSITDQMYQEAQELLELFGVPYLVAPMEAEAQCAFLDLIDLTDGTITDDSDIWLFGGRTVYKNFFNQSKTVMEFKSDNIQQHYKLTREQMVLLAMLVGSDYTTGLTGVGPVTALEILAAFPPKSELLISGLAEFKSWFAKGKAPGPGRTSLRGKLKNLAFGENFPNPQITQAYLEPRVETSKEKFGWAKPDVVGLVDFAREKFGWTKIKTEEILAPVLKRMEDRNVQKSITDFFKYERRVESGETEKKMSKRVKSAIQRIGSNGKEEEEPKIEGKKQRKKASEKVDGPKRKKKIEEKSEGNSSKDDGPKSKKKKPDEEIEILKQTQVRSKKRVEEIETEIRKEVEGQTVKKVNLQRLHKREVIPQKQKEKSEMLKNKLKAIETFRKSKLGPGSVKKKQKDARAPQKDAGYLSESSSSD